MVERGPFFKGVFLFAIITFSAFTVAHAADAPTNGELLKEIRELRDIIQEQNARIDDLENRLQAQCEADRKQQEKIDRYEDVVKREELQDISVGLKDQYERMKHVAGLDIGISGCFIGQGTPNANNVPGTEDDRFDASWTMEIGIGKAFDDWGYAYILMEPGQGAGLDDDLSVFSLVNFDAANTNANPTITEVWYEHYFFDGQLTLTGGKLYIPNYLDTNEYANYEVTQFISQMFRTAENIGYPNGGDWCLGGRVYVAPEDLDFMELEAIWGEGNCDWGQVFDHPFAAAQVNFMPAKAFDYDEEQWGGNYRAYFWYNGTDHTKLMDAQKTKERNYGFGFSCDQRITDVYGVFGRFSWSDPRVSDLEYHWSVGGQMAGRYWNREDDVLAVAVGQAIPGKDYGDAGNPHNSETHLETYYRCQLNEHLAVSPDMQFIWDPNGVGNSDQGDNDMMFIYGVRGVVDF